MVFAWISGGGMVVLVCTTSSFIVKRRLDRWADGMIASFGLLDAALRLEGEKKESASPVGQIPAGAIE